MRTLEYPVCSPNWLCSCNSDDDRLSAAVDQIIRDEAKRKRIDTNTHAIPHWKCILDLLCYLYKQSSIAISGYCLLYHYICDDRFVGSLSQKSRYIMLGTSNSIVKAKARASTTRSQREAVCEALQETARSPRCPQWPHVPTINVCDITSSTSIAV